LIWLCAVDCLLSFGCVTHLYALFINDEKDAVCDATKA